MVATVCNLKMMGQILMDQHLIFFAVSSTHVAIKFIALKKSARRQLGVNDFK